MKKLCAGIGSCLVFAIMLLCFGCEDSADNSGGNVSGNPLEGSWRLVSVLMPGVAPGGGDHAYVAPAGQVTAFGADHSYSFLESGTVSAAGTWSTSGNQLTVELSVMDGYLYDGTVTYEISGSTLTVTDPHSIFTFQRI